MTIMQWIFIVPLSNVIICHLSANWLTCIIFFGKISLIYWFSDFWCLHVLSFCFLEFVIVQVFSFFSLLDTYVGLKLHRAGCQMTCRDFCSELKVAVCPSECIAWLRADHELDIFCFETGISVWRSSVIFLLWMAILHFSISLAKLVVDWDTGMV